MREFLFDRADVPAVGLRNVEAGEGAAAVFRALQPIERAVEEGGDARLRFTQGPFEQRIVAAGAINGGSATSSSAAGVGGAWELAPAPSQFSISARGNSSLPVILRTGSAPSATMS